jgi:hypothetical protein
MRGSAKKTPRGVLNTDSLLIFLEGPLAGE